MDQELKQRLIGAAVVTALAAIFVPMLFDDPVDDDARQVTEMTAPKPPADTAQEALKPLPDNAQDVLSTQPDADFEPPADEPENELDQQISDAGKDGDEAASNETESPGDNEPQWVEESSGENQSWQIVEDDGKETTNKKPPMSDAEAMAIELENTPKTEEPSKKNHAPTFPDAASPAKKPAKPEPAGKSSVESRPKAGAEKPKPGLSRWYVQAGSFSKKDNALALKETLRKQGLPAFLETQNTGNGTIYRLKVGPELDKKRALAIKSKLSSQKINSIILAE